VTTSLTIQIGHVRWSKPGRGAIVVGAPIGAESGSEAPGEPLVVVMPSRVLESEIALAGDLWALQGVMEQYRGRHDQFRAETAVLLRPYGRNMIATISGNRFPGVGAQKARALWERWGEGLRDVLEDGDINALGEVVTRETAQVLVDGWRRLNPGDVIAWLDEHRFPIGLGAALLRFYGEYAADKLKADPYRLLAFGQAWGTVDRVALRRMCIEPEDPRREHAAVAEALYRAYDSEGHTTLDAKALTAAVMKLLGGDQEQAERAIGNPLQGGGWLRDRESGLYSSSGAWLMERYVASRLARMVGGQDAPAQLDMLYVQPTDIGPSERAKVEKALDKWETENHALGEEQRDAVWMTLTHQFSVVSGGAGVGKTATLSALYAGLDALGSEVVQMALAGRAAKRMMDATSRRAITIAGFIHTVAPSNPEDDEEQGEAQLDRRTYVVDEASMLDIANAFRILRKIGPGARLVLVGDDMQLPPVGAGLTFHLLCREGADVPRRHLSHVYRQEGATGIPTVSNSIRDGVWPALPRYDGPGVGVSVYPCTETEVTDVIARLYAELVAAEGVEDEVQILASAKGERGERPGTVVHINQDLYRRRLEGRPAVMAGNQPSGFCEGCPIMFTENVWDRGLYNGSFGMIVEAFREGHVVIEKDDEEALVPVSKARDPEGDLPEDSVVVWAEAMIDGVRHYLTEDDLLYRVQRSFAVTIHKSQGSQWNRVIVPISRGRLLDRTLVYTAATRGVTQVVLVGDIAAAEEAVKAPARALSRTTGLARLLEKGA